MAACLASGRELAVLVIDFDHFKQINDVLGHLFGDRALIAGVAAMRSCLEPDDVLGRFGGEEFVVALEGRSAEAARALAERLREQVKSTLAGFGLRETGVTVSTAWHARATSRPGCRCPARHAADRAMYAAKAAGRNRVERFADAA